MTRSLRVFLGSGLIAAWLIGGPAAAQKQGGMLRAGHFDSPASMSMLEESTLAVNRPMMGVFNNLVMFDQEVAQNSPQSIVPDLAMGWSWNEEGTELTMPLRRGVKWHDSQPFTAKDVKCTWDLLTGKGNDKLRIDPRKSWYDNLDVVTANGDFEVTFHLKRPQPSFLTLLASGWSPVFIPVTCRRATCASIRSALARSNSSNSSRTKSSVSPRTPIIGNRGDPISTV
jgi:peptide/nickel transport system substrate-binding protein